MQKISTVVIAALFLAACNSGLGSKEKEAAAPPPSRLPAVNAPATTTPAQQPAAGATTAALNPAHGQPGHRCDIPEGAPLNSAPVQGTTMPAPGLNMQTAPAAATPVAGKRINPPHGQPGHSCDVPVGEPLP
ncbi:MAG: hypothetical protein ACO1NX_07590 [Chitinophagaceae bacterium]